MQELTTAQTEDVAGGLTLKCPRLPIKRPPVTTMAVGEEGGGITTMMVGEEDKATTLAVGEEGGGTVTTLAIGEEGGGTTATTTTASALGAF
jgi:hypothetical protein